MSSDKLKRFKQWMTAHGITWDVSLVCFREGTPGCTADAYDALHSKGVAEGAERCVIPKAVTLSGRATSRTSWAFAVGSD